MYDEHRVSVVQVTCVLVTKEGRKLGVGTGFVVHNDGASCLVLTCAHVIDPKRSKLCSFSLFPNSLHSFFTCIFFKLSNDVFF